MKKTLKELRKFGLVMALCFTVLSAALLWRERELGWYLLLPAAYFELAVLFAPASLEPVERLWMKLGERIGSVVTTVLLTVLFYLVITPLGGLMTVMGKNRIRKAYKDPEVNSYWVPVPSDGPQTRPYHPF